jgi:cytochrome P450
MRRILAAGMTTTPLQAPAGELDPFGDAFLADPYPGHEQLREAGPVVWLERSGVSAARWCSTASARDALAPGGQGALIHDASLIGAAFAEGLRLEASVQAFFRTTTRAVEVDGAELPEGAKVLLFVAAAHRDPRHCERPDEFDVTRRGARQMTMGAGIHVCVGRILARLEAQILLGALAGQVEELALDGEPVRELNNTLRGLEHLPLRVTPA